MNGITSLLLLVIGVLLGLAQFLFGLLLKAHADGDKSAILRIEAQLQQITQHVHNLTAIVGKVEQWQRHHDQDIMGRNRDKED